MVWKCTEKHKYSRTYIVLRLGQLHLSISSSHFKNRYHSVVCHGACSHRSLLYHCLHYEDFNLGSGYLHDVHSSSHPFMADPSACPAIKLVLFSASSCHQ